MRKSAGRSTRRLGIATLVVATSLVAALALASTASAHHISASYQLSLPILADLPDAPDLHPVLPTISASYNGTVPAVFVDTDEIEGKLLYRFDSVIANQGGTLDVFCTGCESASGRTISQAVWTGGRPPASDLPSPTAAPTSGAASITDITTSTRAQGAGGWLFYYPFIGHDHWHYDRAAVYELLIPGESASRVVSKTNVGFCFFDTYDHRGTIVTYFDATGAGNLGEDPEDLIPDDEDWCRPGNTAPGPNGPGIVRTGISPGVGDYYASQLTDQWVDITGVAPGPVTLRATMNPDQVIIESDYTNNTLEETRTIPGALATPTTANVPANAGGLVEIAGTIVAGEIPIFLSEAQHLDPLEGPQKCALRHGDCYAGADPSTLSFQIVSGPANGTATVTAANGLSATVQYTANPGYLGPDSFTFVATDTRGLQSAPATVGLNVTDALLNIAAPTISGTLAVGSKLKASAGTWAPEPDRLIYQWQRCNAKGSSCSNISRARDASYQARPADGGKTLRVTVTARRGAEKLRVASTTTAPVSTVAAISRGLVRKVFKGTKGADNVKGSRKHDLIKTGRGADTIRARAGSDIIKSGSGDDTIYAGKGKDIVVAGKGDDTVWALDKMRDKINCGPGVDRVVADKIDSIHKSCEEVTRR